MHTVYTIAFKKNTNSVVSSSFKYRLIKRIISQPSSPKELQWWQAHQDRVRLCCHVFVSVPGNSEKILRCMLHSGNCCIALRKPWLDAVHWKRQSKPKKNGNSRTTHCRHLPPYTTRRSARSQLAFLSAAVRGHIFPPCLRRPCNFLHPSYEMPYTKHT